MTVRLLVYLLEPKAQPVEGLPVGHVVDHDDPVRAPK